jgi:N-methylhydantoinase A
MVTRAQSIMTPLAPNSAETIENAFLTLQERIHDELKSQGVEVGRIRFDRAVFAMYRGQTWDNRLPIAASLLTPETVKDLVKAFNAFYQESYGFSAPEIPVVVSTVEVTAVIPREKGAPNLTPEAGDPFLRGTRLNIPGTTEAAEVPIYVRERMKPGVRAEGPALVVEKFATSVVLPGRETYVDDSLNLIIETKRRGEDL